MKESDFLQEVLDIAAKHDVLAYHSYCNKVTSKGFPDLVLVGSRRTIFVELKDWNRLLQPEQQDYRQRLISSGQTHVTWEPKHLNSGVIEETLSNLNY
jgi:hypothetical protein